MLRVHRCPKLQKTDSDKVDILVIGGGPAGSTAASMAAKSGLSVKLFERSKFPREHVGESLLPASIPILEELGLKERIANSGFLPNMAQPWYGVKTTNHGLGVSVRLTNKILTLIKYRGQYLMKSYYEGQRSSESSWKKTQTWEK